MVVPLPVEVALPVLELRPDQALQQLQVALELVLELWAEEAEQEPPQLATTTPRPRPRLGWGF